MSRVLVVDDSSTMRKIIAHNLEQASVGIDQILHASGGREALELLSVQDVDVVLTDLNMPEMSGVDLVREMRASGSTIPVLVLSTSESAALVDDALAAGAGGFVPKPFSPQTLARALQPLLAARS
jgi:two-component system chemotaxis response regulator CheY